MKTWGVIGAAGILSVAFFVVLAVPGLPAQVVLVTSDGTQLGAAALAALACAWAARTRHTRRRRAWWLLCAGTGSWAAGQAVWSLYEIGLREEVPFPSPADIGFLLFPLLAAAGLVTWSGGRRKLTVHGRDVLDGAIIAGSLLVLSWVTALGSVLETSGGGPLAVVLSLAYPAGDVVLGTLVLLALARSARGEQVTLLVLGAGLGGLALADSAYVYLVAGDSYSSADLVSAGWVVGFGLVAVAAAVDVRRRGGPADAGTRVAPSEAPSLLGLVLPYLPLSVAGLVTVFSVLTAPVTPTTDLLLGVALVLLVLCRQFLAMNENRRLLLDLRMARDLLHHRALHDPLTSLPNRALFAERLDQALLERGSDVAVLFCDLDDFKQVNDEHGHDAGDQLLRQVAARLLTCVRATDTVARLGGDEFAILLRDTVEVGEVAERIVTSMLAPYDLGGHPVTITISVGVAQHLGAVPARPALDRRTASRQPVLAPAEREAAARALLTRADTAMYDAKRQGKARAVRAVAEHGQVGEGDLLLDG